MKPYKGMRVFKPDEYGRIEHICDGWMAAATARGFEQYKTPLLDPMELYRDKTSEEIVNEQTYTFTDRGGREVVLRPEITPGVSSMVAALQHSREVRKPLKIFSIGSVFRYEKPQKGRTREHIQYNVDIFGETEVWADAEVIEVAVDALRRIGLDTRTFEVRLNDRGHMTRKLTEINMPVAETMRLLDKREKMSEEEFGEELKRITSATPEELDASLREPGERVSEVLSMLGGVEARYDPNTVRGFDYYTGIVFEIFPKDTEKDLPARSLCGGGRYDNLIASYGGGDLPAVGFGMGDVTIAECMDAYGIRPVRNTAPVLICAESDETVGKAYAMSGEIRKGADIPVSFIGMVPEKKLAEAYKRYDIRGASHLISVGGTVRVRNLKKRKTAIANTITTILKEL